MCAYTSDSKYESTFFMIELDASASASSQPCQNFGLNKNLDVFKEIYDAGDGQFHANTGHLTKPVTKYK